MLQYHPYTWRTYKKKEENPKKIKKRERKQTHTPSKDQENIAALPIKVNIGNAWSVLL